MNSQTPILHISRSLFRITLALLLLFGLTACKGLADFVAKPDARPGETLETTPEPVTAAPAEPDEPPIKASKPKPSPLYEWKGDGRRVSRIVVDTDQQKARFYAGDDEIGWSTVATGVSKYPTPTGQFAVTEKVENKRSNLYGKVYGKGGQVLKSSARVGRDSIPAGGRFEGSHMPYWMRLTHDGIGLHAGPIPNPGQPASHGCIRMPRQLAPVLFKHVSHGTQVAIVGKGPSYGNYVEKQRAIAAARAAEQRRVAAQKAEAAARAEQVAANEPAVPAPARSPVTATLSTPNAVSRVIEEQAQAKDDLAIVEPVTAPTTGETKLKTEPTPPAAPLPATAPAVKPTPDTAVTAAPSMPQPSPAPTLPAAPAPAQVTPAPALPATPAAPAQPAPTQAASAAQPTPAPQPPAPAVTPEAPAASAPPPPAAKPEPAAAPPQPATEPAPAAPPENKAE